MTDQTIPMIRGVEVIAIKHEGRELYLLRDPLGIAREQMVLPPASMALLQFFDGHHTVDDIKEMIAEKTGQAVAAGQIESFVEKLDQALFLDSSHFQERRLQMVEEYKKLPHRPPQFAGEAYDDEPEALLAELDAAYRAPNGPGLPEAPAESLPAAIVAPHIDPSRGGGIYGQAYASIWGTKPKRIVIIGICHAGGNNPFVLTTKDFVTPLGTARTDRDLVKKLSAKLSWDPCAEEDLHLQEHSIEFQQLFIQHALTQGGTRSLDTDPLYLPILCAFPWQTFLEIPEAVEIRKQTHEFIAALGELLKADPTELLIVAGVDFAHLGHRFGDSESLPDEALTSLQNRDMATLTCLARGDRDGFVEEVLREEDDRRLCGFSALYSLLTLLPEAVGTVTGYFQAVDNHPVPQNINDQVAPAGSDGGNAGQPNAAAETTGTDSDKPNQTSGASETREATSSQMLRSVVSFASMTFKVPGQEE